MGDVKRYWVPYGVLADQSGWHPDDNEVVLAGEHDVAMAALREELASVTADRDQLKGIASAYIASDGAKDLRIAAAEQRNAELVELLEKNESLLGAINCSGLMQFVRPDLAASVKSCVREAQSRALRAALKPTESGASE